MLPVLNLDPMVAPAASADALAMLGDQPLKPHPARRLEQFGANFALLEGRNEDSLGPAAQHLRQVGLAQVQRQPAEIIAVIRQAVEGVGPLAQGCDMPHATERPCSATNRVAKGSAGLRERQSDRTR